MTRSSVKQTLRIGIDARELMPNTFTGFGRYLENFLDAEITRKCAHAFVLYGNQHTRFPKPGDTYCFKIIEQLNTMWWDQVQIVKALKKDHIDVFFTPYDKTPVYAPCPVVMTVHDLLYQYVSDLSGPKRWLYNTLYRMQRGYMARHVARVLTVSEHSRKDIVKTYGLNADQIIITYNAVSKQFHPHIPDETILNAQKKYDLKQPYIFNLNNFKPHKNAGGVIEAYARLKTDLQKRVHLVIGGKHNAFTPPLQHKVESLGLCGQIHFPGIIADPDLPAIYAGAELFVIASFYEGFGIPPLEAMACGTPVVSSNATSLPEVIGNAGPLIDPNDTQALCAAIQRVLTDKPLQKQNIENGFQRIALFTQEKVATRILEALETAS